MQFICKRQFKCLLYAYSDYFIFFMASFLHLVLSEFSSFVILSVTWVLMTSDNLTGIISKDDLEA